MSEQGPSPEICVAFGRPLALFLCMQQTQPTVPPMSRGELAVVPHSADRLAVSVSEASAVLGCSVSTVYRMIRTGQLRSARTVANGRIFVNLQSVRDFVNGEAEFAASRFSERKRQLG
jgi:excisionase family DNA binding protein